VRFLLERRPSLQVVGEVPKAFDAFTAAHDAQPDIILLDLDLGDASGLNLLPKLLSMAPQARAVVSTGIRDPEIHRRAARLGAMGLVTKNKPTAVRLQAIAKVHAGGSGSTENCSPPCSVRSPDAARSNP
jgi:DNA-binding NarL/FixJ family response regulator